MRGLAAGILMSSLCSAPILAQERDRPLERIGLALKHPSPIVREVAPVQSAPRTKLVTLVPPVLPGEMVRVSVPIGELVTRAFTGVRAANRRRQEAAARGRVDEALKWFAEQRPQR